MFAALLPPVGFALLALLGLLLGGLGWRNGRRLAAAGLIACLIAATPLTSQILLRTLESGMAFRAATAADAQAPKAIVVLGGTRHLNSSAGALLHDVEPAGLSMSRLRAAAILQRRIGLPLLLSGGDPALSRAMTAMLAEELHVPPRWVEGNSATTWENARLSAEILRGAGIAAVYVVTDGWHMRRALLAFRRAGLIAWPAPSTMTPDLPLESGMLIPSAHGWRDFYWAAHEIVGYAYYALRR
jgi:uncharacterized SAM-binding protein YcdF (DUF218 family)